MGTALKYLLLLILVSLCVTVMLPYRSKDFFDFVSGWLIVMACLGLVGLFLMQFVLGSSTIIKEFDRGVHRLWRAQPSTSFSSTTPAAAVPADLAFEGLHGQDDAVRIVIDTITAARHGLHTHPDGP